MKVRNIILLFVFGICLWGACDYQPFRQGEILYGNFCASCHGDKGEGFRDLYPPLANSDYFQKHQKEVACIVQHGMDTTIIVNGKTFDQPMAAITKLSPVEICNVINFLSYQWNPGMETMTIDEVKAALENCQGRDKVK